jgi:hypothetical protein
VRRKSQQPLGFMESDASRMAREGGSTFEIASPEEHDLLVHQIAVGVWVRMIMVCDVIAGRVNDTFSPASCGKYAFKYCIFMYTTS